MTALQIGDTKNFMNTLLISEQFDSFFVEEAAITTFNTFHIDGHIAREFFSKEELEANDDNLPDFSKWKEIRPVCFQLIKGKKLPVSFRVTLQAPASLIETLTADDSCEVSANLVRSLVLNIRYENGHVTCITGSSFTTFIMDKSVDRLWDSHVKKLFTHLQLDYEEL